MSSSLPSAAVPAAQSDASSTQITNTKLQPTGQAPNQSADQSTSQSDSKFKADAIFQLIQKNINEETVKKVNAVYRFDVTLDDGSASQSWLIDLKSGSGTVAQTTPTQKADCIISMKDSDFVALMTGKLNPQAAYMKGKLKMKGNLMLAQKLSALMPKKKKIPSKL